MHQTVSSTLSSLLDIFVYMHSTHTCPLLLLFIENVVGWHFFLLCFSPFRYMFSLVWIAFILILALFKSHWIFKWNKNKKRKRNESDWHTMRTGIQRLKKWTELSCRIRTFNKIYENKFFCRNGFSSFFRGLLPVKLYTYFSLFFCHTQALLCSMINCTCVSHQSVVVKY